MFMFVSAVLDGWLACVLLMFNVVVICSVMTLFIYKPLHQTQTAHMQASHQAQLKQT
jgi:hypothetical protein